MTVLLRRFVLILAALLVAFASALAETGGDGGWINVPGGGSGQARNGAPAGPRVEAVRSLGHGVELRFAPEMEGSIAWVSEPDGSPSLIATRNATLVFPGEHLIALANAGVSSLHVMVVAPSQVTVILTIDLDPERRTALVRVW